MSTKALKRELAAAIAMLLVAMIALSGSTYAWFASNNKVEAQNMSVTAMSDAAFLEITVSGGAFTGSSVTAAAVNAGSTTSTGALYPVTPFTPKTSGVGATEILNTDGSTLTWNYTYSDDVNVSTQASGGAWHVVGDTDNHTMAESALVNTFYFRMSVKDVEGTGLVADAAKVTATLGEATGLDKGVTILLEGPTGYQVITGLDGTHSSKMYNKTTGEEDSDATLADTVGYVEDDAPTSGVAVTVYVYYDGENPEVYTTNLVDTVKANIATIPFVIK